MPKNMPSSPLKDKPQGVLSNNFKQLDGAGAPRTL
jgi:hypothetical protein